MESPSCGRGLLFAKWRSILQWKINGVLLNAEMPHRTYKHVNGSYINTFHYITQHVKSRCSKFLPSAPKYNGYLEKELRVKNSLTLVSVNSEYSTPDDFCTSFSVFVLFVDQYVVALALVLNSRSSKVPFIM